MQKRTGKSGGNREGKTIRERWRRTIVWYESERRWEKMKYRGCSDRRKK